MKQISDLERCQELAMKVNDFCDGRLARPHPYATVYPSVKDEDAYFVVWGRYSFYPTKRPLDNYPDVMIYTWDLWDEATESTVTEKAFFYSVITEALSGYISAEVDEYLYWDAMADDLKEIAEVKLSQWRGDSNE